MVMKMNKEKFILELVNQTKLSKEKCIIINNCLEDNFIIGKNNKEKIVASFEKNLNITKEEANKIYNIANKIITTALKDKIKHPFK